MERIVITATDGEWPVEDVEALAQELRETYSDGSLTFTVEGDGLPARSELAPGAYTPRCPNCGSEDVREWDLVPVPYAGLELTVMPGGTVTVDATADGGDPAYDGAAYDSLMCRDCDHESSDIADFLPKPPEPDVVLGDD